MSLLTGPINKNSHIYARTYFIFLKNFLKQNCVKVLRVTKIVKEIKFGGSGLS